MHWARLEASALGSLIAACPAWKRRDPLVLLTLSNFAQNFNTKCSSPWQCKNIAKKFKSLPRVQQCHRQMTDGRLIP